MPRRPLFITHLLSRAAVCLLVLVVLVPPAIVAGAQPQPGHAWVVVPAPTGQGASAVWHAPPRGSGAGEVEPGTLRQAAWLARTPTHIASWGGRLWILLERERLGTAHQRRVLTAEQVRTGGAWQLRPAERLEVLPSLPGDVEVAGFVGTPRGPAVLLSKNEPESGWNLLVFDDGRWQPIQVPWAQSPAAASIVADPSGFALIGAPARTGGGEPLVADFWAGRFRNSGGQGSSPDIDWTRSERAWRSEWSPTGEGAGRRAAQGVTLIGVDGHIVASEWSRTGGESLWLVRESGVYPLATLAGVPSTRWVTGMPGAGRVLVAWDPDEHRKPLTAAAAATPGHLRIAEVSVGGISLYSGPARTGGPVTSRDVQILAALLVGVMIAVVLFVLRADPAAGPSLPKGTGSAGVPRRILATAFDFAPALLAASVAAGLRPSEVLMPDEWFSGGVAFKPFMTALLLAWGHSTVGDWLFGGSLGKSMTGCGVVSLRASKQAPLATGSEEDPPGPTLGQAAVRNAVRWFFPMLGVLMLFDVLRRHPGDLLAGTAVVVGEDESADATE